MTPAPAYDVTLDDSLRTPCEVWTRVMGYHRPVNAFNAGKQAEHRNRQHFREALPTGATTHDRPAAIRCNHGALRRQDRDPGL